MRKKQGTGRKNHMDFKDLDKNMLETIIRKVVEQELGKNKDTFEKYMDKSGVGVVKARTVKPEKFDTGNPNDKVYLTDVFSIDESERLSCGVMEMEESTFDWTLNYDEVDYVIEGTLEIIIDGRKVTGNKGDIILIPKGSKIKFSAPDYARFLYVIYPANWQDTCK
jgi:ethanolamine utilization protein EutQ